MNLIEHARQRHEAGIELGRSTHPEHDLQRNFRAEAMEELADAYNYIEYEIRIAKNLPEPVRKLRVCQEDLISLYEYIKEV
jgi:hypothetical protein